MKSVFLIVFTTIFSSFSYAQIQYKFNHFTTDDGLPTNSIYCITENKNGEIILGTDNGLTFFDGNNFKTLNVKDGLINPYIVAVNVDKKGVVWLINYGAKLQKYENNKIQNTSVFSEYYTQIIETEDKFFLYTLQNRYTNKCYAFSEVSKSDWRISRSKNSKISKKTAPPILVQNKKEIKVVDNHLIYKKYKVPIPNEVKFVHKVVFTKSAVWVLDENFLFLIDFKGVIVKKVKLPQSLSVNPIYKNDFIVDLQNNCWLSIQSKGLFILKNNNWSSISENLGLNTTENINFLYCDRKGKIWIATNENGLFCIPNSLIRTFRFKNKENYFNGFAHSKDKKSLFVSSKFRLYSYKNEILNLLQNSSLEIRIGNYNNVPILYLPLKEPIHWDKKLQLLKVTGKLLLKNEQDKHYVFAGNSSINISLKGKFDYKSISSKIQKKEKIKQIILYQNEYYFNNSEKINIRTFDDNFISVKRDLKFKIKGYIEDFIFIKDTMWIAANNSIYKVYNEKIVDRITQINNMNIDVIHKIKPIGEAVYLCANNGLFKISANGNQVLNKYNFLPNNDVYNVALFNNELLVATKDGLGKINNVLLQKKSDKPIFDVFYYESKVKKLEIPTGQNLVKIKLVIQNYNSPKNQIIQYKINTTAWTNSQSTTVDFQSLSYGKNTLIFRVKDVNSDWATNKIQIHRDFPFYLKWWFILIVNVLVVGLIYFIYRYQITKIKRKKQQEIITNNKVAELRQSALSAMMNPHFVFNSLNAIQYFVNSNQKEKSSEYLGKLARLVRLFLSHASEPFISLEDEIKRLKIYLELEKVRFNNFDFDFNIDDQIDIYQTKIPNMIVQPFIENAILHGVSHLKENDGKIDINFYLKKGVLTIEVIDNGFGMIHTKPNNVSHISKGILIIKERMEILQRSYPEKTFSIVQEDAYPDAIRKGHKVVIVVTIL